MRSCEHVWRFQHVVYWSERYTLPGSGARARVYGDRYFCEKCLTTKVVNERTKDNDYHKPIEGTFPK